VFPEGEEEALHPVKVVRCQLPHHHPWHPLAIHPLEEEVGVVEEAVEEKQKPVWGRAPHREPYLLDVEEVSGLPVGKCLLPGDSLGHLLEALDHLPYIKEKSYVGASLAV